MQRCCGPVKVDPADRSGEAALFKALADPHRLTILATLAQASEHVCVCDFTAGLPLNQPTVSHHLRLLREAGLVTTQRRGTWMYYRLTDGALDRVQSALRATLSEKAIA
ncbi:MAG TPA: metalloregulator ArsR/SmtB family transcription factor [Candidatus Baltobacteraceae bacterium]